MVKTISPRQLEELRRGGQQVELIDVRTPAEYREVHVDFAKNHPLDRLDPAALRERRVGVNQPLYVICKSGNRSARACDRLAAAGLDVVSVDGGTEAWAAEGLSVSRGKKTISLERQVRIAAGLLVLTGAALGYFVHPSWIGLAAFVGAGLTFAGITDTCGMGMLLARMPWNQVKLGDASSHQGQTRDAQSSDSKEPTACCGG